MSILDVCQDLAGRDRIWAFNYRLAPLSKLKLQLGVYLNFTVILQVLSYFQNFLENPCCSCEFQKRPKGSIQGNFTLEHFGNR